MIRQGRSSLLWILFLSLAACGHKSVSTVNKEPPPPVSLPADYLTGKGAHQLTSLGENQGPHFDESGERLLYFSKSRPAHKGSQIYEMDLSSHHERRITFSDGDAFDPIYMADQGLIYASTTDEIKEGPLLGRVYDPDFPSSDLYMSDFYGNDIDRLTLEPGYDAQPVYVPPPAKPFIVFTSRRNSMLGLYHLDITSLKITPWAVDKDHDRQYSAVTADTKKWAWIETDHASKEQKIMLADNAGQNAEVLKKGEGLYRDLSFAPQAPLRLFYSIQHTGQSLYQLEVYDIEKKCTQVVLKGPDSLIQPVVASQSPEKMAFTRLFQGKKQIYMVNLPADLGPCLEPVPQDTLKK